MELIIHNSKKKLFLDIKNSFVYFKLLLHKFRYLILYSFLTFILVKVPNFFICIFTYLQVLHHVLLRWVKILILYFQNLNH